jgi:hypothetical protein
MYTVWHVDKYKITFKLVIDHWPAARQLRNTDLDQRLSTCSDSQTGKRAVTLPSTCTLSLSLSLSLMTHSRNKGK